jgi:hypothetical protein
VHDRLCGELFSVPANRPTSRALFVESLAAVVVTEIGRADLQDALGTAFVPELLGPFHPLVELFDQRLYRCAGDGQSFAAEAGVVHAMLVGLDVFQGQ